MLYTFKGSLRWKNSVKIYSSVLKHFPMNITKYIVNLHTLCAITDVIHVYKVIYLTIKVFICLLQVKIYIYIYISYSTMNNTISKFYISLRPTLKNASSNTSSGPLKPMTSTGWAASRQKMIPCILVEIISSDTPIHLSVFSAKNSREKVRSEKQS